jgi:hypothetical protein
MNMSLPGLFGVVTVRSITCDTTSVQDWRNIFTLPNVSPAPNAIVGKIRRRAAQAMCSGKHFVMVSF